MLICVNSHGEGQYMCDQLKSEQIEDKKYTRKFACASLLFAPLGKSPSPQPTQPNPTHALTFKKTLPPIICTYGIIHPNQAQPLVKALYLLNCL